MTPTNRKQYRFEPQARGTSREQMAHWRKHNSTPIDLDAEHEAVLAYLEAIDEAEPYTKDTYNHIVRTMGRAGYPQYSKPRLRRAYLALVERGEMERGQRMLLRLTKKPIRTMSGVAPVTVLTKPYPCPGKCIFCPTDVRMPKSYLSTEPGAMRALQLDFDPYDQTAKRIEAFENLGHTADKVELLILGGTWSSYPASYQEWFIQRVFDALNGIETGSIEEAQRVNETAPYRNVGLVVETRPDHITEAELRRLRRYGVTRIQIGVQSLDDEILGLNKRGHTVDEVRQTMRMLRGAGFKIALHWMPNLLGATPGSDLEDYKRLWDDPAIRPDELKIYPTGLLAGTELYDHFERGEYHPYDDETLTWLLRKAMKLTPRYCRLNRVMRDIPAPEIVEGVTISNLREVVEGQLKTAGTPCQCVRCREVRQMGLTGEIAINELRYDTDHSHEVFISADTADDHLAGFLRLSIPTVDAPLEELKGMPIIRQVQVYGPTVGLDDESGAHAAQHQGLGERLIDHARGICKREGANRWAVIAAVGTRNYYRRHGFEVDGLYMTGTV